MTIPIRLLYGFAGVWFVVASLFIIANLILAWYYQGFSRVQEIISPFNIWNFAMVMIIFSPGFGAMFLADHLEKRKPIRRTQDVSVSPENAKPDTKKD